LEAERPISSAVDSEEQMQIIKSFGFLTLKPIVVAVNIDERQLGERLNLADIDSCAEAVICISAKIEYELSQLDENSREEFLKDLGIKDSAVSKFVNSCYSALGLISFLTVGPNELRAWPIKKGTTALEAAGKIHTDIQRGFIKAETFNFSDIRELGSEKQIRQAGRMRLEGKNYIVGDGDIINFKFNV